MNVEGIDESLKILENTNRLNDIFDSYLESGIVIHVISCQIIIKGDDGLNRAGRFTFDFKNDEHLKRLKGYYLLIVKKHKTILKAKLISANDFFYRKNITWHKLIN